MHRDGAPAPGARTRPRYATVLFDADSTLSAIEGVDWLAEQRDADTARAIAALTERAMSGDLPLDAVYAERVARIRPTRAELRALADEYVRRLLPGAAALVHTLHEAGVTVHIISGGIRDALLPMADALGIVPSRVHAVSLRSTEEAAALDALDGDQPLARQTGKPEVVQALRAAGVAPSPIAMIGDGSTDAAVAPHVDTFIAFTAVTHRPAVLAAAHAEARSMANLAPLLFAPVP
jgi:phosphoserine phosphatase